MTMAKAEKGKAPAGPAGAGFDGRQGGGLISTTPSIHYRGAPCQVNPTKTTTKAIDAALNYAALGWSIIPIEPNGKRPVVTNTKTGARLSWKPYQGQPAGSELIRSWWQRWPTAGVGIVTGEVSGLIVVDIDDPAAAGEAIGTHGGLPRTPTVKTARGRHMYFAHPGRQVNGPLPWGDLKGDGGYVVAPPSIHPRGRPYAWERSPDDCPLAPCPAWILAMVDKERAPGPMEADPPRAAKEAVAITDNGQDPYAEAALRYEADALRSAPEGSRNDTLNRAAYNLGQLVGAGRLNRGRVERELEAAAQACGLDRDPGCGERGVFATMYSGLEAGIKDPRYTGLPTGPTAEPAEAGPEPLTVTKEEAAQLNALHRTDAGNGEALALLYGETLRYNHDADRWLVWDGVRWAPDRDGEPERLAKLTARRRHVAAAQFDPDKEKREALAKWALGSENRTRLQNALKQAAIERPIAATSDHFDTDPWLLGCENGIVDLRNGDLRAGRPDLAVTLSTGIPYSPGAKAPRWRRFLQEIFKGDQDLIGFIHRAIGYTLTGLTREQCLFLCWGTGSNGKSVFLSTLHAILGEHAHNADFATFLDAGRRSGSSATPDLYALRAGRLVTASEVKEDHRLNEARIKSLTGGDPITARPLYGRPVTFTPTFKLWLAVNHKPRIKETGPAIWRRVKLIPFTTYFPPDKADRDLDNKLAAEAPGILAWAVAGCIRWQVEGLNPPQAVLDATQTYRAEQDVLGRFIEERCIEEDCARVQAGELYAAYKAWCEETGEHYLTLSSFGRRIADRGYDKVKDGYVYYLGLGLLTKQIEP